MSDQTVGRGWRRGVPTREVVLANAHAVDALGTPVAVFRILSGGSLCVVHATALPEGVRFELVVGHRPPDPHSPAPPILARVEPAEDWECYPIDPVTEAPVAWADDAEGFLPAEADATLRAEGVKTPAQLRALLDLPAAMLRKRTAERAYDAVLVEPRSGGVEGGVDRAKRLEACLVERREASEAITALLAALGRSEPVAAPVPCAADLEADPPEFVELVKDTLLCDGQRLLAGLVGRVVRVVRSDPRCLSIRWPGLSACAILPIDAVRPSTEAAWEAVVLQQAQVPSLRQRAAGEPTESSRRGYGGSRDDD